MHDSRTPVNSNTIFEGLCRSTCRLELPVCNQRKKIRRDVCVAGQSRISKLWKHCKWTHTHARHACMPECCAALQQRGQANGHTSSCTCSPCDYQRWFVVMVLQPPLEGMHLRSGNRVVGVAVCVTLPFVALPPWHAMVATNLLTC